jgi:hypothetical protein
MNIINKFKVVFHREKLQNNTVQSKHHVNEVAETPRVLDHLKNEINSFLNASNKESLNSIFTKIINVSSSSTYNVNLFGFNSSGRTDLMISPSCIMFEKLMNYCKIQLKPLIKYKYENSAEIIKYSDIKIGEILTQSVTELLSYVRYSDYPMMHCTTDLNKNFHT